MASEDKGVMPDNVVVCMYTDKLGNSEQVQCSECGEIVYISPATRLTADQRYPNGYAIACIGCVLVWIAQSENVEMAPPDPRQIEEIREKWRKEGWNG